MIYTVIVMLPPEGNEPFQESVWALELYATVAGLTTGVPTMSPGN